MTPSERAVIDAARAIAPLVEEVVTGIYTDDDGSWRTSGLSLCELEDAAPAFLAAVRALPRPLSEQLAELRVGAVVEHNSGAVMQIVGNHRPSRTVLASWPGSEGQEYSAAVSYNDIRRIISNPEASNG